MKNKLINIIAAATFLIGTGTACVPMQYTPTKSYKVQTEVTEKKVTLENLVSSTYCLLSEREYKDNTGNTFNAGGYGSSFAYRQVNGYSYLITNQHVVGNFEQNINGTIYDREKVTVKIVDSRYDNNKDDNISLEVVFESEELDLAILRTVEELNVLPEKNLNLYSNLKFGEEVYLIGYPLAMFPATTEGIIANPGEYSFEFDLEDKRNGIVVPQSTRKVLDITINPGNSGGPLFVERNGQFYWMGIASAYYVNTSGGPFHKENSGLAIAMESKIIREIADYVIMNIDEKVRECKM